MGRRYRSLVVNGASQAPRFAPAMNATDSHILIAKRPLILISVGLSALDEVEQTSVHLVCVCPSDAVWTSFDHQQASSLD